MPGRGNVESRPNNCKGRAREDTQDAWHANSIRHRREHVPRMPDLAGNTTAPLTARCRELLPRVT